MGNIERTAPYMHYGSLATLNDVIDFYDSGGRTNPNLDSEIRSLRLTAEEKKALAAFLRALTDERVRLEQAPFDHPSINVPNGGSGAVTSLLLDPLIFGALADERGIATWFVIAQWAW